MYLPTFPLVGFPQTKVENGETSLRNSSYYQTWTEAVIVWVSFSHLHFPVVEFPVVSGVGILSSVSWLVVATRAVKGAALNVPGIQGYHVVLCQVN